MDGIGSPGGVVIRLYHWLYPRLGKTVIITGGHKDNKAHLASTSLIDIDSKKERVGGPMLRGRTYHRMALLGRWVVMVVVNGIAKIELF